MVVVIKYAKRAEARYMSHNDTMRALQRTVRRMGIRAEMSTGFNVHMLTYSSPPLPLGLLSEAEYFAVKVQQNAQEKARQADDFEALYNAHCHPNLPLAKLWILPQNPNLAAKVTSSEYKYVEGGAGGLDCGDKGGKTGGINSSNSEGAISSVITSKKPKEICADYYNLVRCAQFVGEVNVDDFLTQNVTRGVKFEG